MCTAGLSQVEIATFFMLLIEFLGRSNCFIARSLGRTIFRVKSSQARWGSTVAASNEPPVSDTNRKVFWTVYFATNVRVSRCGGNSETFLEGSRNRKTRQ